MSEVKQTKKTLYGSGKVYSADFDAATFPTVADFTKMTKAESAAAYEYIKKICVPENRIGLLKGGYQFNLTTENLSDQDDLGELKIDTIKKETGVTSFNLFNVDGQVIASQYPTAEFSEVAEDGSSLAAIGGLEHLDETIHVIIFERVDKKNGNTYVIAAGKNISGLTVGYNLDNVNTLPIQIACEPLNERGHLCWFYTPPTSAAAKVSTTTTTTKS